MELLGVLLDEFIEHKDETPEIIEIKLGNALQVFNPLDTFEYYFYALRDLQGNTLFLSLEVNKNAVKSIFEAHHHTLKINEEPEIKVDQLFNLDIWKRKGPPLTIT